MGPSSRFYKTLKSVHFSVPILLKVETDFPGAVLTKLQGMLMLLRCRLLNMTCLFTTWNSVLHLVFGVSNPEACLAIRD